MGADLPPELWDEVVSEIAPGNIRITDSESDQMAFQTLIACTRTGRNLAFAARRRLFATIAIDKQAMQLHNDRDCVKMRTIEEIGARVDELINLLNSDQSQIRQMVQRFSLYIDFARDMLKEGSQLHRLLEILPQRAINITFLAIHTSVLSIPISWNEIPNQILHHIRNLCLTLPVSHLGLYDNRDIPPTIVTSGQSPHLRCIEFSYSRFSESMANPEPCHFVPQVICHDSLHLLPEIGRYKFNYTTDGLPNFSGIHASVNRYHDNIPRFSLFLSKPHIQRSLTSLHWKCFALDELPSVKFGLFQVLHHITVELSLFENNYSSDAFILIPASLHRSGSANWVVKTIEMIFNVTRYPGVQPVDFNNVDYRGMKEFIERLRPVYPQLRKFKFSLCVEARVDNYDVYSSHLEGVRRKMMETFNLDVPLAAHTSVHLEIEIHVKKK